MYAIRSYYEIATGFPGYNSVMGPESATIAKILKENGYRTSWYGKNSYNFV